MYNGWVKYDPFQLKAIAAIDEEKSVLVSAPTGAGKGVTIEMPNLLLGLFGPALSRETLGGRPEIVREVIANGTPRMPGFKYNFAPAEIDAIVAYLQTLPPAEKR